MSVHKLAREKLQYSCILHLITGFADPQESDESDADLNPTFHADPDPTFHFDAAPDPAFYADSYGRQSDADLQPLPTDSPGLYYEPSQLIVFLT